LGSTAKKAVWNSNRPLRFPKANLNIYIRALLPKLIIFVRRKFPFYK
jgi:hypothetical protein